MKIRAEQPADYSAIYEFVQTAFSTADVKDGDEQNYVNRLRAGEGYIQDLALIAEDENGRLIGHIMLTGVHIVGQDGESHKALLLAPLAVLLEERGKGVGGALIREALSKAAGRGYAGVFLVGNPDYYSRFGFIQAASYGVVYAGLGEEYARFVQGLELAPGALEGKAGLLEVPH